MLSVTTPQSVEAAVATARRWAAETAGRSEPPAARLLARVLAHPRGLAFTLDFVDGVLRPEDPTVAGAALGALARRPAPFLPLPLRWGLRAVRIAPRPALPLVRAAFAALVGDLVIDVGRRLGPSLRHARRRGADLNVNLLGEAVLGDAHAAGRLRETMRLLARDDVDYVSIKVSAVLGPHSPWAHAQTVEEAVTRLRPLMLLAARAGKFVNLDMEEYRDLHLTLDVFAELVLDPELLGLRAGLAVQTYLKESGLVLRRIDELARRRVAAGGAPLKVRLVKGANLAMERVQAELRGWENPVLDGKAATDAGFLRALEFCLTPERAARLLVGVASHNVYTVAAAWELAKARGVTGQVDVEMLSGMGAPLQRVILREVGRLRLYVPVVPRAEFDSAISYLVRRLEENAAPENFMSGAAHLGRDAGFLDMEEARFRDALTLVDSPVPQQWATQARPTGGHGFVNAQDTEPALRANQAWAAGIHALLPSPGLGAARVSHATVTSSAGIDETLRRGRDAGAVWAAVPPVERAAALRRLAGELEAGRTALVAVVADEVGKLIDQADVEVSEAVDFAHYYAERAIDRIEGAHHVPPGLTVVAPPWNFPIAIPLGGVAAALAAGSAVLLKPAPPARRTASLLAEACDRAGLPPGVVQFVVVDDGPLGESLLSDRRVDLVILTGAAETASLFRSWRPSMPLLAETSGKNAIVVTPSADLDLAVADLVTSAFGHAGQKCSAASLGILVGSVARSRRFRDQLLDAVGSLRVAWPIDPAAQMGPLTEPPRDKLLRGLTGLEPGQRWLIRPRRHDDRLWSPGVRAGVRPGSEFHQVEYFGPVLGLMEAASLTEALRWQNGTPYGLTAGLHSLDEREINTWLDGIEAGNCYVNRTITGAIVRRQPFGGWKRSAVGPGAKAGGPHYVQSLGRWEADEEWPGTGAVPTSPMLARLVRASRAALGEADALRLGAAAAGDEEAARAVFLASHDPTALSAERNVLRYRPATVTVRVEECEEWAVFREASAALAVGARAGFSVRRPLSGGVAAALDEAGLEVRVEDDARFDAAATGRIRHLGRRDLLADLGGSIDATVYPGGPLPGRLACLPYVREQSVSLTAHRFGHASRIQLDL
ncbi:bifunctional proline dehydrogenase/L-glutamate gamma-semialdehyde dehydrogenase [Tessaracoccus sp. MC1679]|uniref:bifunctional proline dehydrogenase/L-glutamate gamma-semialdehyde dehydrogenase n=1 Tax=Tessaracoccus sp. MC1679 TaxID=2760313 RepID=UPI0016046409|nr:bifunctional proline dehydrogenase/L-glutamate gamma-semialdehyde dehydrogenase [Tessaracoccus sp. MC1679]MBB1515832.1 bifunctional proline dehydrogenase/L-glutamate gamma-semialdehyde dehydrogenase [Tessaracoccus sp. MC1679]